MSKEPFKVKHIVLGFSQAIHFRVWQSLSVLHVTKYVHLTQNIGITKNIAVAWEPRNQWLCNPFYPTDDKLLARANRLVTPQ